ncbi:MAG: hypothetical protein M9891_14595 [Austwickia sp.]|nr:hypothetical protein [Actinomycetota bacterium]MCB1254015.1 hypothetical protein [Austwickia sp.]MCO5310479.1 hypothetical protein [Austwickia sp.]
MANSKPLKGKIVGAGPVDGVVRRVGNVVRSDEVRRAVGDVLPAARRLGEAVVRAWQR